jgi:hypothetical protein
MPLYRVTIRLAGQRQQYHVEDVSADSLQEAIRITADRVAAAASPEADLVEIRVQVDPDLREFTPELP